jgi:hypothetical protein
MNETVPRAKENLFSPKRLARRPYATDDLDHGLSRHAPADALERAYIEANCTAFVWRVAFDVDREGAALAAEHANVATPNWIATRSTNAHAHLGYELDAAVVRSDAGRLRPLRYLAAIEDAYTRALGADTGYTGLICKNPHSAAWRVQWLRRPGYSLGELAEYVDLQPYVKGRRQPAGPLGRNCLLFDSVRQWAYREIRAARAAGLFDQWQAEVVRRAAGMNLFVGMDLRCTEPLALSEVRAIAKSIARWTWTRFDLAASDARFSALQAARGRRGGQASGKARAAASADKRVKAYELHASGLSQSAIAAELGVTQQAVSKWLRNSHN